MSSQNDSTGPSRRDVLAVAGAAGIAAGVGSLVGHAEAQQPAQTRHVIIVGAGLSGLCAAYQVQQRKGWTYTILEAERQHIGGRIRTMPMDGGLRWEAGAMRIPEEHKTTLKYVKMFGLKTRPFVMTSAKTFKYARNTKAIAEADIRKLYNLTPAEDLSSEKLWRYGVKRFAEVAPSQPVDPEFDDVLTELEANELRTANKFTLDRLIDYDRLSLRQLIQTAKINGQPLSDEAIEFLLFSFGNLTIQHGAATEFLREENIGVWDKDFCELEKGSSSLPNAFKDRLKTSPKMGHEVIRLERAGKRVRAHYRHGNARGVEEGDFLICTIPFPVLAGVQADPPFSSEKRRAILEMGYDSGTKVAIKVKKRFWELNNGIYGGVSTTDLMSGSIIYPSDNAFDKTGEAPKDPAKSHEPAVLLASYCWGQDARRLGALPASEREATVVRMVSAVHPELCEPGMIMKTASWAWDTYRWCGGAFAFYQPGQFQRMHKHVIEPEGRIYFAGEHCSHSHSWMQGALESAESAVDALVT
jgi:monoamine oxidase